MKTPLVLALIFSCSLVLAQHREHGAHVHGSGKLAIALNKYDGKVEFESPAGAIIGFEHAAKSAKDKKAVEEAFAKFESQMKQMIQTHPRLNCAFKKDKMEIKAEGEHSDFVASFTVNCMRDLMGTSLTIDLSKYPELKDVDVTVLAGDLQKSAEVKSSPVQIDLKP